MSWKREQLKKALRAQLETQLDAMLEKVTDEQQLTLTEIEELVLQTRQAIGQEMTQALAAVESQPAQPDMKCAECGQKMQNKGKKARQLTTQSGEIMVERNYYYCPSCRVGLFPPG